MTPLELATAYATLAGGGRRPVSLRASRPSSAPTARRSSGDAPPAAERVLAAEQRLRGHHAAPAASLDRGTGAGARRYGVRGTARRQDRHDRRPPRQLVRRLLAPTASPSSGSATTTTAPPASPAARGALPIWSRFTARAEPHNGWSPIAAPAGFVTIEVDPETGLLATPYCPRRTHVELPDWRAPLRSCDTHLPQLAWWQSPYNDTTGLDVSESLTEYISRSSPRGDAGRLHSDVTRISGEGADIRIGRGNGGETPVEIPQRPGDSLPPVEPPAEQPLGSAPPAPPASGGR